MAGSSICGSGKTERPIIAETSSHCGSWLLGTVHYSIRAIVRRMRTLARIMLPTGDRLLALGITLNIGLLWEELIYDQTPSATPAIRHLWPVNSGRELVSKVVLAVNACKRP